MNLLEQALAEGQTRGWVAEIIVDEQGRVCGLGALMAARGTLRQRYDYGATAWEDLRTLPQTAWLAQELARACEVADVDPDFFSPDVTSRVADAFNALVLHEREDLVEEAFRLAAKHEQTDA